MLNIPIIYEDENLLAINKPSGVAVNKSDNETNETIQDWSEIKLKFNPAPAGQNSIKNSDADFVSRGGIVHRLDKETSGILLIAKNELAFQELQKQFFERSIKKTYFALVHGEILEKSQIIKAPVGRLPWNRRIFGVIPDGRDAETVIEKTENYLFKNNKFTLINALPKTGRTHQIRIHLKYINHPVVSDSLYAGRKIYKSDINFCPRLFLHATKIQFYHPLKKRDLEIVCKLPQDLNQVLEGLTS